MKKSMNTILSLTVMAILFSSCGAESDILSQFSKRKYLKKSKATKYYELATADEIVQQETTVSALNAVADPIENELKVVDEVDAQEVESTVAVIEQEGILSTSENTKSAKNWSVYNRAFKFSPMEARTTNKIDSEMNHEAFAHSSRVSEVLIAILCIFIPPLAVYLYEDSITTNFWVDLIATILFWIPGIVVAFLICFGGVSF